MALDTGRSTFIRGALGRLRGHTCTWTPVATSAENLTVNPWGGATRTPGTPVTGLPCLYSAVQTIRVSEVGRTVIDRPTLRVAHDLDMAEGDTIADVRDSEGVLLAAGPFKVGELRPAAALGPTLQKRFELLGAEPAR